MVLPIPPGASKIAAHVPGSAGLPRRLAAIFYDTLLITALLMLVTWLLLPLTGGRAIVAETPGWLLAYRGLLIAVLAAYFGLCWTRGGQTLGMLAWRIRVVRENGARLRWRDAGLRLAAALLSWIPVGLGYLWLLVDREGLTWHDRLSKTRVVNTERPT